MGQALAQFDYRPDDYRPDDYRADDDVALLRPLSPLAVAVFADRGYVRAEMAEDAAAAGLRVTRTADLGVLLADPDFQVSDIVLVDCPVIEASDQLIDFWIGKTL